MALLGVYISPNRPFSEFEDFLEELAVVLSRLAPAKSLILSDFIAKSIWWGNSTH